jgi:hypothetical protein
VVAGKPQFCPWRTLDSVGDLDGRPVVKGVWNGVGLALLRPSPGKLASVTIETEFTLAPGDYTLSATLDIAPDPTKAEAGGSILFSGNDQPIAPVVLLADLASASRKGQPWAWRAPLHHTGGPLHLMVRSEVLSTPHPSSLTRLWLSDLRVEQGMAP